MLKNRLPHVNTRDFPIALAKNVSELVLVQELELKLKLKRKIINRQNKNLKSEIKKAVIAFEKVLAKN